MKRSRAKTKSELLDLLRARLGVSLPVAKRVLEVVLDTIVIALRRRDQVVISGFGRFAVRKYAPFMGHDPLTGSNFSVSARCRPVFRPSPALLERINNQQ
jgi:nucleoid DNA-binding protein